MKRTAVQRQLGNGGQVMQQGKAILQYLLAGNTITSLEALKLFGCLRLSGRIYDLKKAGYEIDMELIDVGNGKHVASYKLSSVRKGENYKLAI